MVQSLVPALMLALPASGPIDPPSTVDAVSVAVGVGDDACALMLTIEATINDTSGKPVAGAELWLLDRLRAPEATAQAYRIGTSDSGGRLRSPWCEMGTGHFRFWNPQEEPLVFSFFVIAAGHGSERVELRPPLGPVLSQGALLATKPGEFTDVPKFRPDSNKRSYPMKLAFSLARTAR